MLHYASLDSGVIQVLLDEEACAILIETRCGDGFIPLLDTRVANLRVLSEDLSDTLGYGPCVELLQAWGIPPGSPLWTLRHKGGRSYYQDRPIGP